MDITEQPNTPGSADPLMPDGVRYLSNLMFMGAGLSFLQAVIMTSASFCFWFPAWTYGLLLPFSLLYRAAVLRQNGGFGKGVPTTIPVLCYINMVNLDLGAVFVAVNIQALCRDPRVHAHLSGLPMPETELLHAPAPPPTYISEDRPQAILEIQVKTATMRPWMAHFSKPNVSIDGVEMPAQWGLNAYPIEPGEHRVEVYYGVLLQKRCALAEHRVWVAQNQVLTVLYKPELLWPNTHLTRMHVERTRMVETPTSQNEEERAAMQAYYGVTQ